jgi:8-oxo-dGTP pyrophosphatase MutT (NUDIX family)
MADPRAREVLDLLDRHRPADTEETEHLRRIRSLAEAMARPFERSVFAPGHLTASGFVLDPSRERLLLIHHRRLDIWIQPGGHIDPTDAGPESAARREIAEETGIRRLDQLGDGLLDVDVHHYPARPGGDPAHLHFDLRFGYAAADSHLEAGGEVHGARWVTPDELAGLGMDRSILRPAAKLFCPLT